MSEDAKPIYLTEAEISGVTGRVKPTAQLKWLTAEGIKAKRRADGTVLVSRAHFEEVMGDRGTVRRRTSRKPNFDALNNGT